MTFVQKYIYTPVAGAAGLAVGLVYLQKKYNVLDHVDRIRGKFQPAVPVPAPAPTIPSDWADKLERIVSRLAAVENRQAHQEKFEKEWKERLAAQFAFLEERVTDQNEHIRSVEKNYKRIEDRLDAILHTIDRSGEAHPNGVSGEPVLAGA